MPAYVIVDIDVTDPDGYEEYKRLAPPTISLYAGRYLARGGQAETLEGDWTPNRLVILEFPDRAYARQWLESPEYGPARSQRHRTARTRMVVVDGVVPG
jgi:uncharacterized protein (DUF1330 family)